MRFPLLRTLALPVLALVMTASHAGGGARSNTEATGGANAEGRLSAPRPSGPSSGAGSATTGSRHGKQETTREGGSSAGAGDASRGGHGPGASSGTNNPGAGQTGVPKMGPYPGQTGGTQPARPGGSDGEGPRR